LFSQMAYGWHKNVFHANFRSYSPKNLFTAAALEDFGL